MLDRFREKDHDERDTLSLIYELVIVSEETTSAKDFSHFLGLIVTISFFTIVFFEFTWVHALRLILLLLVLGWKRLPRIPYKVAVLGGTSHHLQLNSQSWQ